MKKSKNTDEFEITNCPFCRSNRSSTFRNSADIVKCLNCGIIYLRTRLKKEAMYDLYQSYNSDAPQMSLPGDISQIKNSPLRRDYWLKEIIEYASEKGNLLDVGCGWGAFLDNSRTYGFTPFGVEITRKGADFAKNNLHLNVIDQQLTDASFEDDFFSVVTLNHVIEHLPEPKEAITKIFNILKPGGLFCGIVPNIGSLSSEFLKENWEWLDPYYHYIHFDTHTLSNVLKSTGFIIEKCYTVSGDFNRNLLGEALKQGYRPVNDEIMTDILKSVEKNNYGEEIRFIARKPERPDQPQKIISEKVFCSLKEENITASIIIPVFNKVEYTQQCLEALYSKTNGIDSFEVIVVDNNSSDHTTKFLEYAAGIYKNFTVIKNNQNLNFGGACNVGAKNSRGKYFVFLNNDTIPVEKWLIKGLEPFMTDHLTGITGSKLLYPDRSIQHAGIEFLPGKHPEFPLWPIHRYLGFPEDEPLANVRMKVDAVTGACLFIPADLFRQVKGFSEEYKMYFEDSDLCFKVRESGKNVIYQPESIVIHFEGKSNKDESLRHIQNAKSAEIFYRKWKSTIDAMMSERNLKPDNIRRDSQKIIQAVPDRKQIIRPQQGTKKMPEVPDQNVLSVIAPLYNNLEYSKQFIESYLKEADKGCELILIDNSSSDGTREFLDELSHTNEKIKVISNETNLGFPAAVNQGLLISKARYVMIANNDIVLTPGCLKSMKNCLESDPQIGIAGPLSNYISGPQRDEGVNYRDLEGMLKYSETLKRKNKGKIDYFPRVAFLFTLIRGEVIEKIGGLDERFSPGNFEDDDFCLRVQLAGYKTVIAQDVFIHHYGSKSFKSGGDRKYDDLIEANRKKFINKWGADPNEIWLQGKPVKKREIKYPINPDLFIQSFERALIHIDESEYLLAGQELAKAVASFHSSARENYNISYSDVTALAEKINQLIGNNIEPELNELSGRAEEYINSGKLEQAKDILLSILKKEKSINAMNNLAYVYILEKNYGAAVDILEQILNEDQTNEMAINNLRYINENM